jgi:hypothetical protein
MSTIGRTGRLLTPEPRAVTRLHDVARVHKSVCR